jgi:hypothetical protein
MATQQPLPASASATSATATAVAVPSRSILSSKPWRLAGFLLAGAAQLITISALLSVDPLPATWSALLLAIAPAPLAAVAAFSPRAAAKPVTVAAAVAILVGVVGGIGRTGSLFIPALVALVVGGFMLWRAKPR